MSCPPVEILDTTLRDGAQAPGVCFSIDDRVSIAAALDAAGVAEIEAGTPAMGREEVEAIRETAAAVSRAAVSCWCRMTRADLDAGLACGTPILHLSLPVSNRLLGACGRDVAWAMHTVSDLVREAVETGRRISVGFQDASRADEDVVFALTELAAAAGAFRVRLADTVGILTPLSAFRLFTRVRMRVPEVDLDVHAHNDLGMATANTLMAVQAGATTVNVTVNGLGERTGNAPLEEVVMGLEVGAGVRTGIDSARLYGLSRLVAERSRRPVPCGKPVVGSSAFTHVSGLHVLAEARDPASYEPFPPDRAGQAGRTLLFGRLSGRGAVRAALEAHGVAFRDRDLETLLARVKAMERARGFPLSEEDVCALADEPAWCMEGAA